MCVLKGNDAKELLCCSAVETLNTSGAPAFPAKSSMRYRDYKLFRMRCESTKRSEQNRWDWDWCPSELFNTAAVCFSGTEFYKSEMSSCYNSCAVLSPKNSTCTNPVGGKVLSLSGLECTHNSSDQQKC
eukprot:IDg5983t1